MSANLLKKMSVRSLLIELRTQKDYPRRVVVIKTELAKREGSKKKPRNQKWNKRKNYGRKTYKTSREIRQDKHGEYNDEGSEE